MEKITLSKLIASVDKNKVNAYSDEQKTEWVNKLEGMVQLEIQRKDIDELIRYNWDDDKFTELIIPYPYADIYVYYLYAMIDYENREIGSYNNNMSMFNEAYSQYEAFWKKQNPGSTKFINYW